MLVALAALPWLLGFQPEVITDRASNEVASELAEWRPPDDDCVASAYGALAVDTGRQRVIASFSQGLFVFDSERHVVADAPGFVCAGSADELVALAAGDVFIGSPVIALAATSGGRAENITWLSLYRVGQHGALETLFTGTVERHEDHQTRTGTVTIIPGGLIYRTPEGRSSIWIFDGHRYVEQGSFPAA
jgi:hypothetical protein